VEWTIHVKIMSGLHFDVKVQSNSSIGLLRQKIMEKSGISSIRIITAGRELKLEHDQETLQQARLDDGHTVHVVQRVPLQQQSSRQTSSNVETASTSPKIDLRELLEDERIY